VACVFAAPSAVGRPCPIAPPVSVIQSWRAALAVAAGRPRLEVCASSMTIASSGRVAPTAAASVLASSGPRPDHIDPPLRVCGFPDFPDDGARPTGNCPAPTSGTYPDSDSPPGLAPSAASAMGAGGSGMLR
jgi:hypothetical protein